MTAESKRHQRASAARGTEGAHAAGRSKRERTASGGADSRPTAVDRRGQRRRQQAERTRRAILEAAGRVIGTHGFAGATMEQVAREAGYSVGGLYKYFSSKQELLHAQHVALTGDLMAALGRGLPESLDARQRFELLVFRTFEVVDQSRGWALSVFREGPPQVVAPDVGEMIKQGHDMRHQARAAFAVEVRRAIGEGSIRDIAPERAASFLLGAIQGMVVQWLDEGGEVPLTSLAPALVEVVFDGIGAGQRRPPSEQASGRARPEQNKST